ncbi:hypothetical protein P3L10_020606 [Capsicum annuum]
MKPPVALILLITIALYASSTDASRDPGEYWRIVTKNEPMPANCNYHDDAGLGQKNSFEQSPAVTACYHDDAGFKQQKTSFVKDFEQRPTATSYRDNEADLEQEKSFEPRPTVTSYYHDDVGLKQEKSSFTKEFEPRPTATSYRDNEASLKNEKSFEPRSNVKCVA